MRELNRRFSKTVVMVTHDPRAERHVDEIYRLDKGVLIGIEPGKVATEARAAGATSS